MYFLQLKNKEGELVHQQEGLNVNNSETVKRIAEEAGK